MILNIREQFKAILSQSVDFLPEDWYPNVVRRLIPKWSEKSRLWRSVSVLFEVFLGTEDFANCSGILGPSAIQNLDSVTYLELSHALLLSLTLTWACLKAGYAY